MIIKFVMKFLPTCLPSGLTVAAPDAFGRIPGVLIAGNIIRNYEKLSRNYSRKCLEITTEKTISRNILRHS